jgi:uroporphyrinogen-III synthase
MAGTRIADALRNWGAEVVDVVAYVNRCPSRFDADLRAALPVEISTIFSGSAAKRIADAVPDGRRGELGKVVVIGPSTAAATVAHGLHHHAMADPHTVAGMVAAVGSLPQ